uniref:hypothetical protein n=1 Tax=Segatella hominis TaxID=2518605 RepID=UPI004038D879
LGCRGLVDLFMLDSYDSSPNLLSRMTIVSCSATVMFLVSTTSLFTSISVMVVMMSFLCFHEYLSLCLVYIRI